MGGWDGCKQETGGAADPSLSSSYSPTSSSSSPVHSDDQSSGRGADISLCITGVTVSRPPPFTPAVLYTGPPTRTRRTKKVPLRLFLITCSLQHLRPTALPQSSPSFPPHPPTFTRIVVATLCLLTEPGGERGDK